MSQASQSKSNKRFQFFVALQKLAKQFGMTRDQALEFANQSIKFAVNLPK